MILYFSTQEMELLKLIGWCKHIAADSHTRYRSAVFSQKILDCFQQMGLVFVDKHGKALRLTPQAYRVLDTAGIRMPQDSRPRSEAAVIKRRVMSADALLTFYRAGINVYADNIEQLAAPFTYLPSFTTRRGRNNILNSTVFLGVYRSSDTAYIVFNVTDGRNMIHLNNELKGFMSLCEQFQAAKYAVIFMGRSTEAIAGIAGITSADDTAAKAAFTVKGAITFAKAYTDITWSVHFIPCNDNGAWMLRLMQIPDYRAAIAKAALGGSFRPPYPDAPDTDAIHYAAPHMPAVIAIDMDTKRIDRAIGAAQGKGFAGIALYVLEEQQSFAAERYGQMGCEVFALPMDSLQERLMDRPSLYEPPLAPYHHEGRYAYF